MPSRPSTGSIYFCCPLPPTASTLLSIAQLPLRPLSSVDCRSVPSSLTAARRRIVAIMVEKTGKGKPPSSIVSTVVLRYLLPSWFVKSRAAIVKSTLPFTPKFEVHNKIQPRPMDGHAPPRYEDLRLSICLMRSGVLGGTFWCKVSVYYTLFYHTIYPR